MNGQSLWSERYDLAESEFFDVSDAVTNEVVSRIAASLESEALARARRVPAESWDSYSHLLQGIAYHHKSWHMAHNVAMAIRHLTRFQDIKTERGLIDYNDMEQLALRALDEPAVAERFEDELELLLVDEFQDTNPMQFWLFMKLAQFAREVVFVGDVKQAIYGFRGSDPELVHSTLDALAARGCTVNVLESSWRSRPSLVRYLNAVFVAAFERDGVEPALVKLAAERVSSSHFGSSG